VSKIHKPALDEMGIALHHEVAPHRPGRRQEAGNAEGATATQKNSGPRSTLGRPGMRGGWKPRRR
jgi:excinuclease ABC subunit B